MARSTKYEVQPRGAGAGGSTHLYAVRGYVPPEYSGRDFDHAQVTQPSAA